MLSSVSRLQNFLLRPIRERLVALVEHTIATDVRAMRAEISALRDQVFALERLATGTVAARPPGAEMAVAALASPAVAVIIPTLNRPMFLPGAICAFKRPFKQGVPER